MLLKSEEEITDDIYKDKLEMLKYGLEQDFNFSTKHIPEEMIDAFVKEIVVCMDCFIWKWNFFRMTTSCMSKAGATIIQLPKQNFPLIRHSST